MIELNNDQLVLLEAISKSGGASNWYKLGRACLGLLSSPGRLSEEIRWLVSNELLSEEEGAVELPVLRLTRAGEQSLKQVEEELLSSPAD